MRVLFVATDFPYNSSEGTITQGGGGACVAQLANALHNRGIDIEVVTSKEPKLRNELYDFPIHRTKFYDLPFFKRESKITHYLQATKECIRLLTKKNFDIIHTHNPTAGLTGCKVSEKYNIPHVMTLHGPWASVRQRIYTRMLARLIEGKTVKCSDIVTCDSHDLRDEMITNYNPPKNRIVTIWNAIESDVFKPVMSMQEAREKLGIKTNKPIVFYTGRFVEEKGLSYLLEAFRGVKGAHLLLIGGGFDENLVKNWLKQNTEFKDNVTVIPYLPYAKMPLAYNACDIFVLPSLAEGFSRSIMEAMSCEKPIIATNVGGNKEEVAPEETGLLVEPKNAPALVYNIQRLVDNPKLRATMGKNARKFVLENLTVGKRVESFIKIYNNLLEK